MSRLPTGAGVTLVGLGLLLVSASILEQPDRVQLSPHRFYTLEDRDEYQQSKGHLHELKRTPAPVAESQGQADPASPAESGQATAEAESRRQSALAEHTATVAVAESRLQMSQQKLDNAFNNQETLSGALKWIGIVILGSGAVLLLRASRSDRLAQSGGVEAQLEASSK